MPRVVVTMLGSQESCEAVAFFEEVISQNEAAKRECEDAVDSNSQGGERSSLLTLWDGYFGSLLSLAREPQWKSGGQGRCTGQFSGSYVPTSSGQEGKSRRFQWALQLKEQSHKILKPPRAEIKDETQDFSWTIGYFCHKNKF